LKSLHICNDSTGAQIKERAKEHIQASKPSNIIATQPLQNTCGGQINQLDSAGQTTQGKFPGRATRQWY
jgi:hypothetical protein